MLAEWLKHGIDYYFGGIMKIENTFILGLIATFFFTACGESKTEIRNNYPPESEAATSTEETGDETGDATAGETGGETTGIEPMGEITGEDSKLDGDFEAVSAYALYSKTEVAGTVSESFTIMITDYAVDERSFTTEIKDYEECTDLPETEETEPKAANMLMVTFSGEALDGGFPKNTDNEKADASDFTSGLMIMYQSDAAGLGKANFDGAAPSKVGDEFTVDLDLDFAGKTYQAKVKSKVVELMEQPEAPTCPEGQYAKPIYE